MSISDHEYVNFSQDHELDYHLDKAGKRQTANNRSALRAMKGELKGQAGEKLLTHKEFHDYVNAQKHRLE